MQILRNIPELKTLYIIMIFTEMTWNREKVGGEFQPCGYHEGDVDREVQVFNIPEGKKKV